MLVTANLEAALVQSATAANGGLWANDAFREQCQRLRYLKSRAGSVGRCNGQVDVRTVRRVGYQTEELTRRRILCHNTPRLSFEKLLSELL